MSTQRYIYLAQLARAAQVREQYTRLHMISWWSLQPFALAQGFHVIIVVDKHKANKHCTGTGEDEHGYTILVNNRSIG
jgi:hypothetical protein